MQAASDPPRQLLVVAGSGRSGTSLFTGLTACLGFHVPKPEVATDDSNPRGFSEPRWAVDFHDRLLERADVAVEDGRPEAWNLTGEAGRAPDSIAPLRDWLGQQFAVSDRVVVKDPRLAWFIELYREVATDLGADLHVATLLRDPVEVLHSRVAAYGTKTNNSSRAIAWINTMLGIERRTRDLPRATVRYPDLLTDWRETISRADVSLQLGLLGRADPTQLAAAEAMVDPSLRRAAADWDEMGLHPGVSRLLAQVYAAYGRLAELPLSDQGEVRDDLDRLSGDFAALYDESFDIALHRTRATVRRERRKAIRRVRAEMAESAPDPVPVRARRFAGRVGRRVRSEIERRRKRA